MKAAPHGLGLRIKIKIKMKEFQGLDDSGGPQALGPGWDLDRGIGRRGLPPSNLPPPILVTASGRI